MYDKSRIAIVGGGVAGVTSALYLAHLGLNVTLFEKRQSLVDGPPWCHLHAGGNLYREISDEQCVTLLKQSIDFVNFYPYVVDYRPTVIALPLSDKGSVDQLLPRLNLLQKEYEKLVRNDNLNKVLGESENYYRLFSREKMEMLKKRSIVEQPRSHDEWMISVAKNIAMDEIQFPLILVQEYGLNMFRLAAGSKLAFQNIPHVTIQTEMMVEDIIRSDGKWKVSYSNKTKRENEAYFDYLINAAGFKTGEIDDMLGIQTKRMVEFKASYISKWDKKSDVLFPEMIFHGERGTPQGMAQFTPYPGGYFQLHGMTNEITLDKDGLAKSTLESSQPQLEYKFIQKIDQGWNAEDIHQRTQNAIDHVTQYIPSFDDAIVGSQPLYGAQQIPGDDPTLRVAEVSFPRASYARCEIVKVSSSLDMVKAIISDLIALDLLEDDGIENHAWIHTDLIDETRLKIGAEKISTQRGYPASMARLNVKKPSLLKYFKRIHNASTYMDSRLKQRHRA
ncbi:MAG: FAD-dependent oxidoreductase [Campylobacterota bacterium]|nr:FAD-dependent oxidoreductase [Campylobacterota bacterium]